MPGGLPTDMYEEVGVRHGDSPNFSADLDGAASVRWLLVDWSDVGNALWMLLGYSEVVNGRLVRYLPDRHPNRTELFACRVLDCTGLASTGSENTGVGKSNTYKKALLKVEYGWRPYDVLEPQEMQDPQDEYYRFVERQPYSDSFYVTPPGMDYQLKWAEQNPGPQPRPLNTAVGRTVPSGQVLMTWHQVPYDNLRDDTDYVGKVNKTPLGNINWDPNSYYKEGTLYYQGRRFRWGSMLRQNASGVIRSVTVEYRFNHQPRGWNRYPDFLDANRRHVPVEFHFATIDGSIGAPPEPMADGRATYDYAEMKDLFKVTT